MNSLLNLKPPIEDYSEEVLFGSKQEQLELIKRGNEAECVIFGVKTFVNKNDQWGINELQGRDKRLKSMLDKLQVSHAFQLQRLCWPLLNRAQFPFLCVSAQSTGKTYAYLLFIVSRCITKIPIKETEQAIASTDRVEAFKTEHQSMKERLKAFNPSAINQTENFDWNSLGKKLDETNQEESIESNSGWGLETKEHYEVNPDDFITHPKYIIICSSQQQVDLIDHQIDSMKLAAFGDKSINVNRRNLSPIVRIITVHHSDDKLALKCNDSEILLATPAAILKCLRLDYLTFTKCEMVIFDDLDVALQLHNTTIREITKRYLIETQLEDQDERKACQIFMFSRKWTLLVQQFMSTVFLQRTLIYGSMIEASNYVNLRFELEITKDTDAKLSKILELVHSLANQENKSRKTAIVCKSNKEAAKLAELLTHHKYQITFLDDDRPLDELEPLAPVKPSKPYHIYVLCDSSLEQIEDLINDIHHLVHFSLPEDLLVLDQRFRLMHKHISNAQKNLMSTIFMNQSTSYKYAKELYDVISRSSVTLNSTRLQLRDFIDEKSNSYCWRWASTGVCRLEKLSKEDKFGSYCSAKHSLSINENNPSSDLPQSGQVRITMTHIVSPNEFYFRFESHRDKRSVCKKWTKMKRTGSEFMKDFQSKLDAYRDTPSCSVPLGKISKGNVYGIYLHDEVRVDRIVLLDDLKRDDIPAKGSKKNGTLSTLDRIRYQLEYSKQCEAYKLDYGTTINVYLRNIIELPQNLSSIKAQCHRGFHLGVRPTDNEPFWLYKAKKYFYDQVCVSDLYDITAWIRLNNNNNFWFENMVVRRRLSNIDESRIFESEPHKELHRAGFADLSSSEPACLHRSDRLETLSLWQVNQCLEYVQYAYLRKDKEDLTIFVLHILNDLELKVRNHDYNKQLIDLEDRILEDFNSNLLEQLNYFAPGSYCIAKIEMPSGGFYLNRCKIRGSASWSEKSTVGDTEFIVDCLDHGDQCYVKRSELFLASPDYIAQLPFQAISCKLANLNLDFMKDVALAAKMNDLMYSITRDENDDLIPMKCQLNQEGHISLYAPVKGGHVDVIEFLEKKLGVTLSL